MSLSDNLTYACFGVFGFLINTMDFVADDLVTGKCFKEAANKIKNVTARPKKNKKRILTAEEEKYGEDVDMNNFMEVMPIDNNEPSPTFSVQKEEDNVLLNNAQVNELLSKYTYNEKILAASLLFICGVVSDQQVGALLKAIDNSENNLNENIETINSIVKFYTGNTFAPSIIHQDREFGIDPETLTKVVREMMGIDILKDNDNITNIIDLTKKYAAEKTGKTAIIFNNSKLNSNKSNVSEAIKRRIEGWIGDIIHNYEHIIINDPNADNIILVRLTIDESKTKDIPIDNGSIMAEYKAILRDYNGFFHYTSNKDLIKRFIEEDYVLNDADIARVIVDEHQFSNSGLYGCYVVSAIQPKLDNLEREAMNKFESKLQFIIAILQTKFKLTPAMRVKNFKDQDNFILVSDIKVNSAGLSNEATIFPGLFIKSSNNNYEIIIKDENGNILSSEKMLFGDEFIDAYNNLNVLYENIEKAAKIDNNYNRINNPELVNS